MKNNIIKIFIVGILSFQVGCYDLLIQKPYKMVSISMQPTIFKGDRVFVDLIYYSKNGPKRGDIVIFKYPEDPKKHWIKRLVAFGGETIEIKDGKILINDNLVELENISSHTYTNIGEYGVKGKKVLIPKKHYFVLGDNSKKSLDSRFWGFVPEQNLVGKVTKIYWPFSRFGDVK